MSVIRSAAVLRARASPPVLTLAHLIQALLWLVVVVNVLFLGGLIISGGATSDLVNVWISLSTQWVPVTVFWLVAWHTGFRRLPVLLAAIGVTLSAFGDTYYSFAMDADGFLAFPSPADAGYLLFYPLMVAALFAIVRTQVGAASVMVLLESLVATLGASAVLAVILDPTIRGALEGESMVGKTIAAAYPLFDLLLLAVIAGIMTVPAISLGRRSWALVAGLGVWAAADVIYAYWEHEGSYLTGTPLDSTWAIGLGFITWWVAGYSRAEADATPPLRRSFPIPLPALAVLAGLTVLVIATQVELSVFAVVLAAATVGLAAVPVMFRQAMLGRMLAAQREAVTRLTRLDSDKTDMMVTMNHEFRTPLTSINGNVELLLDGDAGELPPLAVSMIRTIESNGARLQDLVDDMLTVTRLEAGVAQVTRTPIYVSGLVQRAAALVTRQARGRGVELITECDNFALVVDADGTQLERALVNVIDNAVKFTPAGGRVIARATGPSTEGEILITVSDTGMGIPEDDIPHVFSRFFRAGNVQGAAIPGVGLGLAITASVVDAHGGTVTVDSTVDEGTTVTVRLPTSVTGVLKTPRPE